MTLTWKLECDCFCAAYKLLPYIMQNCLLQNCLSMVTRQRIVHWFTNVVNLCQELWHIVWSYSWAVNAECCYMWFTLHTLQVGPKTTPVQTYCHCDHLTSFGSGFIVQPNAIDFAFVFSHADFLSNPTLYITEIVIAALYIMLFIWARRRDKKDLLKVRHSWNFQWLKLCNLENMVYFSFHISSFTMH